MNKKDDGGPSPEGWSALLQAQLARYDTVFSADNNIDNKLGVIIGAVLVVAALVLDKEFFNTDNNCVLFIQVVACSFLLTVLVLSLYAIWPRGYNLPANSTKEQPEYTSTKDEALIYQLIVDSEAATEKVYVRLKKKAAIFHSSVILFTVSTLAIIVIRLLGV